MAFKLTDGIVLAAWPRHLQSLLFLVMGSLGCEGKRGATPSPSEHEPSQPLISAAVSSAEPEKPTSSSPGLNEPDATVGREPCPRGMQLVSGGTFWMGSPSGTGADDERPRFQTRVADFCIDENEVTVGDYDACVSRGACSSAARGKVTCNAGRQERLNHPVNCVSWEQATTYCADRGARLPTEVEWEYAARGGPLMLKYSWGEGTPDGRACWKTNRTCVTRSFASGAYGLYDMQGNVWEWTSSAYGLYPWPASEHSSRVYRGGSWSRRFEKWMSSTLRNRMRQTEWGSHLGFRCAASPPGRGCPYGFEGTTCRAGVDAVECGGTSQWNGARCAAPGAPQCASGSRFVEGRGCVREEPVAASDAEASLDPTAGVSLARTPQLDEDCRKHQPTRPYAAKLSGGSHHGRNLVGARRGCKNRDVGVGWNSACCPAPP